jgi:opacity protein-like surface antigen
MVKRPFTIDEPKNGRPRPHRAASKGRVVMSRGLAVAAAALSLQAVAALAADMPRDLPLPAAVAPPILDLNTGWYLRGDLGYNWGRLQGAEAAPGFSNPTDNRLNGGFVGGLGAGIKTRWLRTDLTVDYSVPQKYEGTVAAPNDTTAKIGAFAALFNGYLDLGTWYGATPYLGAGAGAALVTVSDYSSTAAPPISGTSERSQWNFA